MSAATPVLERALAVRISSRRALAAIVLLGAGVQTLLARSIPSPTVFPDEYLYSQLGRSLATTGHLRVRGVSAHFLPMLEPILTAPAWLVGDVGLSYRLIQLENGLVFSLSAIPAFLIARRLGVPQRLALAAAALTILMPSAIFTARILSEPFAFPLALAVVAAALAVVERPSRRAQIWLLVLSGLATFARLQLGALPIAAAAVVLLVGWRGRRLRETLREQSLLLGAVSVCLLGGLTVALVHGFGYYHLAPQPAGFSTTAHALGLDVFVIVLATGAAIVPSACVGVALAVARPRTTTEQAFGLLTVLLCVGLLAQCLLWGDVTLVQERYLAYLIPLLAIAFCLRATRPSRRALAEAGVAAAVACFAALVPLSGPAVDGNHALTPTLRAFSRLQSLVHTPAAAAAVFALGATLAVALGAALARPRRGAPIVMGVSIVLSVALFVGAQSRSSTMAHAARDYYLPADAHWIDHLHLGASTMLVVGNASGSPTLATLFWNPTIERVVRAGGSNRVDWIDDPLVAVAGDGTVRLGGAPLRGPIVLATDPVGVVTLAGAKRVGSYGGNTVWQPAGAVRLSVQMTGRLPDGRVLESGDVHVWHPGARFAGWVELDVSAPASLPRGAVTVRSGKTKHRVAVSAGQHRTLRVPVCGTASWHGSFQASPVRMSVANWVSPRLSVARYVADASACR